MPQLSMWAEYANEMLVASDRVTALDATAEEALHDVQSRVTWKFSRVMRRWALVKDVRLSDWSGHDSR